MSDVNINGINIELKQTEALKNQWNPEGQRAMSREDFLKANPGKISVFMALDTNKDGYVSEIEWSLSKRMAGDDGIITDKERNDACMDEMQYFAKRDVDKWFKIDKNRDGKASLVEARAMRTYSRNGKTMEGPMSIEELTPKYGKMGADGEMHDEPLTEEYMIQNDLISDYKDYMAEMTEYLRELAREKYGVELSEEQINEIIEAQKEQLNTWLMKTGDNENASGYQQLNQDAYSRLLSICDGESCCGGDICEIPGFSPSNLEKNGKYTAEEMKARLDWASNSYEVDDNGQTVYDANGQLIPKALMTPKQVEDYKKIVESVTGMPWDSDDWEVSEEQFREIMYKVNDTFDDPNRLNGKTRADIPANRQALLKYLEENGLLLDQFKE